MIRLHERQLAMLVLHFCLRYTIQCITRVQQGPQSSILFRMGPHQIVPSQALLSQSDTAYIYIYTCIHTYIYIYIYTYTIYYYNNHGYRRLNYSNMTARMLPPIHINTK